MGVYLYILWRRKWIILVTLVSTVALVTVSNFRADLTYSAISKVRVVPFGINRPDYGTFLYFDQLISTLSDILTSRSVVDQAKQELSLERLPTYEISVVPNSELLQITVTDTDPELAQTTANTLTSILIERSQADYSANFDNIESSLGAQLSELEAEINELILEQSRLRGQVPINTVRIAEIERILQLRQNTYNNLSISYNQALVAQAEQANLISLIEPASLPLTPTNRGLPFWVLIGGGIGLVGGIVLAILLENMQPRIYNDQQLEAVSSKKPLGHIPKISRRRRIDVFEKDLLAAEMIRRLRESVSARLVSSSHKSLLVASAQPNIDNTVLTYNLAVSFALSGDRVLLVDADMRQPKLQRLLSIPPDEMGLSDLLHNQASLEMVTHPSEVASLYIISAGSRAADSAELLNRSSVCDLVQNLQKEYDVLVFNGPPLLAVTDSLILARVVGNAIMSTDAEPLRQAVTTAVEALNQVETNFLGVVVTKSPRSALNIGRPY